MGVSASVQHPSHHHICLCALWSSFANLHSDPTQIPTSLILELHFAVNPIRVILMGLEFHCLEGDGGEGWEILIVMGTMFLSRSWFLIDRLTFWVESIEPLYHHTQGNLS